MTSAVSYCPPESFTQFGVCFFKSTTNKAQNYLPVPTKASGNLLGKCCRLQGGGEVLAEEALWVLSALPRVSSEPPSSHHPLRSTGDGNGNFIKNKSKDKCKSCPAAPHFLSHPPVLCWGSWGWCSQFAPCWCLPHCCWSWEGQSQAFSPSACMGEDILPVCLGEILVCPRSSRSL